MLTRVGRTSIVLCKQESLKALDPVLSKKLTVLRSLALKPKYLSKTLLKTTMALKPYFLVLRKMLGFKVFRIKSRNPGGRGWCRVLKPAIFRKTYLKPA